MFHIEDQPQEVQDSVYALISKAEESGIQLTTLDIDAVAWTSHGSSGHDLFVDGMNAEEWLEAMTQD